MREVENKVKRKKKQQQERKKNGEEEEVRTSDLTSTRVDSRTSQTLRREVKKGKKNSDQRFN